MLDATAGDTARGGVDAAASVEIRFDEERTSLPFRHPAVYDLVMRFFADPREKRLIREMVGRDKSVLEPGCGFGRHAAFLDPSCRYRGFDLNARFVEHARRRGRDVVLGDVFDPAQYRGSDVVLLIDILHHLPAERVEEAVALAVGVAREKLIVIEPTFLFFESPLLDRLLVRFTYAFERDGVSNTHPRYTASDQERLFASIAERIGRLREHRTFRLRKHVFSIYELR